MEQQLRSLRPEQGPRPPPSHESCLVFDPALFESAFNRKAFLIRHRLADQPLFQLKRIVQLARTWAPSSIEYNPGDIPIDQDPGLTPASGLSPEETIRRIETCRSWLVLKRVDRDPGYRAVMDRCLDEVRPHTEPVAKGMGDRQAFLFVSSPGSVTPYHIDPEYNFLLQIRGTKTVHVFDPADRDLLSDRDLEGFLSGGHRNLRFDEACQGRARTFVLKPGDGLHIPVTAPHWVRNGTEPSVSFSITFRTPASDRRALVYSLNAWLRRRGLTPTPYGASAWRDGLKGNVMRLVRRAR